MSKYITVTVGPIQLEMPCPDNQELQYAQAEAMMAIVMKEFRDEFAPVDFDNPVEILN